MQKDNTVIRSEMIQGLLYDHTRINLNTIETHNALASIEALLESLIELGILTREEFEERRKKADERLRARFVEQGMGVAIQEHEASKYAIGETSKVDCENRIHLCQAACCRLQFALSKEDVEEGIVRWDLGHPYFIARAENGCCTHLDPDMHVCDVYQQRPMPCREYDCSKDGRVWQDFERKIINPRIGEEGWPDCLVSTL